MHKHIGIIGRLADHGDDAAINRVNRNHCTGLLTQRVPGSLLHRHINRQNQIGAGNCILALQHMKNTTAGVGFNPFKTAGAMQFGFPELLNANFSDHTRAAIIAGIDTGNIGSIQPADIAENMGQQLAVGVVSGQVGNHVHTGKSVPVNRETGNLLLAQVESDRHAVKHPEMTA